MKIANFWMKVDKKGPKHPKLKTRCWIYTANKRYGPHRRSYVIHYGEIPPDKPLICHACDNPRCVNPKHLFAGTQKDNMTDMHQKGRQSLVRAKGDAHYSRTNPEKLAWGDSNGSRLHPESRPRGNNHPFRKNPSLAAHGDRHGSVTHPERVARGERSGMRKHPESVMRGEKCTTAKLKETQIPEIRKRLSKGESQQSIANSYGVSQVLISMIKLRKAWAHVK